MINIKYIYIYDCFFIEKSPGQWILGGGWNIDLWGGGYPEASWLDSISPENPVCH
jgi:predicted amidohydrolase YtcJ